MVLDINSRKFSYEYFNPDAMDYSDLVSYRDYLNGDVAEIAKEWLPTYSPHCGQAVIIKLWLYCVCKVAAMDARLGGRIQHAMAYEAECDKLYQMIPEGIRW